MSNKSFSIIFFLITISFAQNKKVNVDSLKLVLTKTQIADSSICKSYLALIRHYKKKDVDSCKIYFENFAAYAKTNNSDLANCHYFKQKAGYFGLFLEPGQNAAQFINENMLKALDYSKRLNDPKLSFEVYSRLAQENARLGHGEDALEYAKEAESIALEHDMWEEGAYIYGQFGKIYNLVFDKTELALKYLLKSDSIYESHNFKGYKRGFTLSFIGDVYQSFDDFDKAFAYQEQAFSIFEMAESEFQQKFILSKMAIVENSRENYENAIVYATDARSYYNRYKYPIQEAMLNVILSDIYYNNGQLDEAIEAGENGIDLNRSNKHDAGLMVALLRQSSILRESKNYIKSNQLALEAEELALNMEGFEELADIYKVLYQNSESLGDFKRAYHYSNEYTRMKDSLYKSENIVKAKEIEAKYQAEKKEQEIALLKTEKDLIAQKQKSERNLLLSGLAITTIAGLSLFFLYRNRKRTNNKLKELDHFKSKLFANISHEFRTPLTLISGYAQKQLENRDLKPNEKQELETINRNSNRLEGLVNQMLDLAKLESGHLKLRIKQDNLSVLLNSLVSSFELTASKKLIDFTNNINGLENVWFDADIIQKISTNILSNAFKYCEHNGKVSFKALQDNKSMVLEVSNTTKELTETQVKNIFNRFYQADENKDGVGVGLSLVKELVDLYRGTINVHQSEGIITFSVSLPIAKELFRIHEILMPEVNFKGIHSSESIGLEISPEDNIMLVVDDNYEIRELVKHMFQNDFTIIEAKDGEEGCAKAIEFVPDVIISDLMMPNMDGFELTEILKQDERTSHIPIVLLTAKSEEEDKYKGLEIGADDYVMKPFKTKMLKTRVNNLIKSRLKLQERYSQEIILKPKDIAISSTDELFLEKLQGVMDSNLTESSFNVQEFSSALALSRMQLHRKLKGLTGLSATEFIRSQRLKLAVELLKKSDVNISEIGYSVGFNDHSYFTKCFKEQYGCSPSDYLKKL
ncbi:hybrid sensor histidine kinase/response regulator transcription factor [Psychroserpens mesophilus]|uniref:hybrid sensor histidine kinase/response regulator transcription factor n=1 Tax=Psychroserpens mesophilus TaxID=325473 RepID=UPI003F496C88